MHTKRQKTCARRGRGELRTCDWNQFLSGSASPGSINVGGTNPNSPGSALAMRFKFLASRFFLASSDMPGKWLVFWYLLSAAIVSKGTYESFHSRLYSSFSSIVHRQPRPRAACATTSYLQEQSETTMRRWFFFRWRRPFSRRAAIERVSSSSSDSPGTGSSRCEKSVNVSSVKSSCTVSKNLEVDGPAGMAMSPTSSSSISTSGSAMAAAAIYILLGRG